MQEKVFTSSERNLSKATSNSPGVSDTRPGYSMMTKCARSVPVQGTECRSQARGKHCLLQHIKHGRARKAEVQTASAQALNSILSMGKALSALRAIALIRQAHSLKCLGSAADHRVYSAASLQLHRHPN